jgi:hypothetical protein
MTGHLPGSLGLKSSVVGPFADDEISLAVG